MPPTSVRPASRTAVDSTGGRYGSRSGSRAHAGSIATEVAASTAYGGLASTGSGGVSSRNCAASRAAGGAAQFGPVRRDPLLQLPLGARRIDYPERGSDAGSVGDVAVATPLIERRGSVKLVRQKETVNLGDVHPFQ